MDDPPGLAVTEQPEEGPVAEQAGRVQVTEQAEKVRHLELYQLTVHSEGASRMNWNTEDSLEMIVSVRNETFRRTFEILYKRYSSWHRLSRQELLSG